jgi:hypothetical protein
MAYDLYANNTELSHFHTQGWTHLLAQFGTYFPFITQGAQWYALFDGRMDIHHHPTEPESDVVIEPYPSILCNCGGFEATEEEAKVLARMARNYVSIQRTLDETHRLDPMDNIPYYLRKFPQKIRSDWVDNYEQFADWAEQSQGFKIY